MKQNLVKFLCVVIALTMFALMAVASGSDEGSSPEDGNSSSSEKSSSANGSANESANGSSNGSSKSVNATIDEQVLLDDVGVKITAKSLDNSGFWGPDLKILIENESDSNLTVQVRDSSVNGYMISTSISSEVVSGKKVNDSITFSSSDLKLAGINTIADMEFSFHIFYTDNWDTYYDSDIVSIKTSVADSYNYEFDDSGDVLIDQNGVKIVLKGLSKDSSILGPAVLLYIENNTNEGITIQARNTSVNGFMIDPIFSSEIGPNKKIIDDLTFMSSDMEENGITDIENVELYFHVFSTKGWNDIFDSNTISLSF